MLRRILIFILLLVFSASSTVASTRWEEVNNPPVAMESQSHQSLEQEEVEIVIADGAIYVQAQKTVQVKIFTILGQLISSQTLSPGTHKFKLNSRGIYILRIGTQTRRITI